MNLSRREFLTATGVAVAIALLPTTSIVANELPDTIKRMSMREHVWLHHLRMRLYAGDKVMYVTNTQQNAMRVYNLLDRHVNLHCNSIGGSLCGRRADFIMIDDFKDIQHSKSVVERQHYQDWYNCALRTRLIPNGEIEWVYT